MKSTSIKPSIDISSFEGKITKLAPQKRASHLDTTVRSTGRKTERPSSWVKLIKENNR